MSMRRLWVILLCLPAFCAEVVPNRYIVELSTESVGAYVARTASRGAGKALLHSAAAQRQRTAIRAQQAAARTRIEAAQGKVLGAVETLNNALVVEIADSQAARLASIPGVVKVLPVHTLRPLLDHALPLHNVPQAWSQVGISNAGAGIKIGMIDSGIDIGHPGFADGGFTMPAGFPLADTQADLAYTNNKVVVARSYANLFATVDPDLSAADHLGHGTATAMVAAGVSNAGPLATISGVAPQAWLGSYKVFGTPGYNSTASDDIIMLAINDAVNDGMDIINLSLGGLAFNLDADTEAQILDVADSLGVIVVAAAGNGGSDPYTINSPADAPLAIAAGAMNNDRFFADGVVLPDNSSLVAVPGNGTYPSASITGSLTDVFSVDGNGLACSSLPAGSLTGTIALIFRGTCTFESKIDNAQAAGAAAVVVYDNIDGEAIPLMAVGAATLPAVMISNADGLTLKPQAVNGFAVTVQLVPGSVLHQSRGHCEFLGARPEHRLFDQAGCAGGGRECLHGGGKAGSQRRSVQLRWLRHRGRNQLCRSPGGGRRGHCEAGASGVDGGPIPFATGQLSGSGMACAGHRGQCAAGRGGGVGCAGGVEFDGGGGSCFAQLRRGREHGRRHPEPDPDERRNGFGHLPDRRRAGGQQCAGAAVEPLPACNWTRVLR